MCPGCRQVSDRVHSRYVRHVADEAVGGRPVVIDLSVRRLYCEWPDCPKTTSVEQVEGLTERYQRRTPALRRVVRAVGEFGRSSSSLLPALHVVLGDRAELPDACPRFPRRTLQRPGCRRPAQPRGARACAASCRGGRARRPGRSAVPAGRGPSGL
ncbi:transposase family protein [Streptomyces adustus]